MAGLKKFRRTENLENVRYQWVISHRSAVTVREPRFAALHCIRLRMEYSGRAPSPSWLLLSDNSLTWRQYM